MKCIVEDCDKTNIAAKSLCHMHYRRQKRHGTISKKEKTITRPAIIENDYALLPLGVEAKHGYTKIDIEDIHLEKYLWTKNAGYAKAHIEGKLTSLHKLLTNTNEDQIIDHINRDRLDNRKLNLRITSKIINSLNRNPPSSNTSGHSGVSWAHKDQRWCARITYNQKKYHLGSFKNKKSAIEIREKAESNLINAILNNKINLESTPEEVRTIL